MYTLFAWFADDEGGYSICRSEDFSPNLNYYPESGWRARPSVKIGDFNTFEELVQLILLDSPCRLIEAEDEARLLTSQIDF